MVNASINDFIILNLFLTQTDPLLMNPNHKVILRNTILIAVEAIMPTATAFNYIKQQALYNGFNIPEKELLKEISYLVSSKLLEEHRHEISKGLTLYKLTAEGRDYLEESGLI